MNLQAGERTNVNVWCCRTRIGLVFVFVLAGTSCGGGGGGSSPPANVQSVPAPKEPFSISATLNTTYNGNSLQLIYRETPNAGLIQFQGQMANNSSVSLTVTENGVTALTEVGTSYYLENPYSPLGAVMSTNGVQTTFVVNSYTPYPKTLTVGASGPVDAGTYYDTSNVNIGGLTSTYTVAADDSTSVLVNIDSAGSVNGTASSQTETYTVDTSGDTSLISVKLTVNGVTLTFM